MPITTLTYCPLGGAINQFSAYFSELRYSNYISFSLSPLLLQISGTRGCKKNVRRYMLYTVKAAKTYAYIPELQARLGLLPPVLAPTVT